jgi:hypothetical protein
VQDQGIENTFNKIIENFSSLRNKSWSSRFRRLFIILVVLEFWPKGFMLLRKTLYHLNHAPRTFCFSLFLSWVLSYCLGPALDCDPPTSHIAWITGMTTALVFWRWGGLTVLQRLTLNNDPHISTSCIVTGMHHHAQHRKLLEHKTYKTEPLQVRL